MDSLTKFNNQSSGRDKLFRLTQYSSRIVWAWLEKQYLRQKIEKQNLMQDVIDSLHRKQEIIEKLKILDSKMSNARKLFRFGTSLPTLHSALKSIHLEDPVLRYTVTLSRISMGFYLLTDHIIWLNSASILRVDKGQWSNLSYRLWLYSLVLNLIRDFYEIKRVLSRLGAGGSSHELRGSKAPPRSTILCNLQMALNLARLHKHIVVDTVKNGCDLFLPLAQLGHVNFSPWTIGVLGTISTVAGCLPLVDSSYKMSP